MYMYMNNYMYNNYIDSQMQLKILKAFSQSQLFSRFTSVYKKKNDNNEFYNKLEIANGHKPLFC